MSGEDHERIEAHRRRLLSLSTEEADRYFAVRAEADHEAELRRRRREHVLHQLGIALMWVATVVFAYGLGYSHERTLSTTTADALVTGVLVCFFGGLGLMGLNRHRRDD